MGQYSTSAHQLDLDLLTRREREILVLLAQAHLTNHDIAEQLFLAPNSVKWYVRQIYGKLGVNDRKQAVARAREIGLLGVPSSQDKLPANNLPVPITPFVGRAGNILNISKMLEDPTCRLISLTGTGGVGKTRLAIKIAQENLALYPQGIWFVELAALAQDYLVPDRTAAVFGLLGNEKQDPIAALKNFLRSSKLLLILDNCEHLIDSCASMVDYLLQSCPYLKIMITSRQSLGIVGEFVYVVPPLNVPDLEKRSDSGWLMEHDAVQLFVNRAMGVKPGFRINQQNQKDLVYICNKLDGIPLALELAAARLKVLDIEQIARHLKINFELLSGGGRTAPARHKTIDASIEWSYNLLSPKEQQLLQQLAIFKGGWMLEAAQAICGKMPNDFESDTENIDLLAQLIDKSLIFIKPEEHPDIEIDPGATRFDYQRYQMLEPIQQFAQQKLRESGGESDILKCHLSHFLMMAEKVEPLLRSSDQVEWLNQLDDEIDNFRLALDVALKTDIEAELRLGSALMWFWHIRGRWAEGFEWLQQGLNASANQSQCESTGYLVREQVRAKALSAAGFLQSTILSQQNDSKAFDQVFPLFRESLTIFRRQRPEDRAGMAFALLQLARSATGQLDVNEVIAWANQSLSIYREYDNFFGISECLLILANNEMNPARAKKAFEETIKIKRKIKDIEGIAFALMDASSLAIFENEYGLAENYLTESLMYSRKLGNPSYIAMDLYSMAWIAWVKNNTEQSLLHIQEALNTCKKSHLYTSFARLLLLRCEILLSLGKSEEANQEVLEALGISQTLDNKPLIISVYQHQGKVSWTQGNSQAAIQSLESALALSREIGNQLAIAKTIYLLGWIHFTKGELIVGKSLLKESLKIYSAFNSWHNWLDIVYLLGTLASINIATQNFEQAVYLYAKVEHLFPLQNNTLTFSEKHQRENDISQTKMALGDETFNNYWQKGISLPMSQMIVTILNDEI